jgi:dUTP pyrophosphatase
MATTISILLHMLEHAVQQPQYQTNGAAGADVFAANVQPIVIPPGGIAMVPTGICVAIPEGYEIQVRSRSGLAANHGVFALNAPGTVDSDYRGEIKVILANMFSEPFTVERGMRVAQLVLASHLTASWNPAASLPATQRGEGGFGSTGVSV